MAKREKKQAKKARHEPAAPNESIETSRQDHAPKKQPVMLAISVVLFALWFVFLLMTAMWG